MTTAIGWFWHCLRHYAKFSGRASRPEYWWFQAVVWIVNLILHMLSYRIVLIAAILTVIWNLGVVIPHVAVASRRLHDTGHSFWWMVPPMIVGFVVLAMGRAVPGLLLVVLIGLAAAFVWLLCEPGDHGPNRYGDPAPTAPN